MRKSSFRRFLATRAHLAAAVVLIGCGLYAFQPHASEFFDTSGMPRHATTFVEQQIVALIAGHKPGNLADAAFIQRKLGKYYADQGDEARAERAFILAANADDALMPHSGDPEPRAARPDGVAMTRTDPPQTGKLPGSYYGYEGRTLHTWDFSADGTFLHTWIAAGAGTAVRNSERGRYALSGNTVDLTIGSAASAFTTPGVGGRSTLVGGDANASAEKRRLALRFAPDGTLILGGIALNHKSW